MSLIPANPNRFHNEERVRLVVRSLMDNTGFNPIEQYHAISVGTSVTSASSGHLGAIIKTGEVTYAATESSSTAGIGSLQGYGQLKREFFSEFSGDRVIAESVIKTLRGLFWISREEWFEVGKDSNLSVGLRAIFARYPNITLNVLPQILKEPSTIAEGALCETLRTIGNIDQAATASRRLFFLIDYLKHASSSVRDCAALAISYLDDMEAAPYLAQAVERERIPSLKADMRAILDQLGR